MKASDAQRVTDPGVSAWVSANAGAGKTHLLTDRVTRLLLARANPSRILCLTYTKAAASEMATRLFGRLGEWALLSDDALKEKLIAIGAERLDAEILRQARRLFAQALETPGGLKIQTIHSFCQHLLSRFPLEAGIPPRFTVLDERSAAELMTMARNRVLKRASGGESELAAAVATLSERAHDGRFADILNLAIGDSAKLDTIVGGVSGMPRFLAHLRATLDVAGKESEAAVLTRFCAELALDKTQCQRVAEWLSSGSPTDKKSGEVLAAFLESGPDHFEHLRGVFFTKNNGPRQNLVTRKLATARPELAAYLEDLRDKVAAAHERRKAVINASLTEAVVTAALAVLSEYQSLKRARAALDYDDLIRATVALLDRGDAALWVLYKLDGGIDHILVDEAQDTSPEQWKIVSKLAGEFFAGLSAREAGSPRTLFAVGDEKQSIFSFQGADPAEFGRWRDEFMNLADGVSLPFVDLRPAVSRRSARSVLQFVDALFANEVARDGLTSTGDPIRHEPHRETLGRVEVWPAEKTPEAPERNLWDPVDTPTQDSAPVKLATRIAKRISGWIKNGATIPGTDKPVTAGDIMILVRRRNAFTEEMIRQLLEQGVPVAGADRMVLMDQIAIADLVALGRFALLPEDNLTLAALLKSPLVGFSDDDLFALAHERNGTLWRALSDRRDESPLFGRAHAFLSAILSEADFAPPFEFYARALGGGLKKKLVARLGGEAIDAIDEFLGLALTYESAHPPSLEGFVAWFEKGASEIKRDMEQGGGAVRVMTVHGAKGLEADIVILPDTAQIPDHERRAGLLYSEDCVFFGVPQAMETEPITRAKTAARAREMREYRRLLYVAATRTREWLIVCGYQSNKRVHEESWHAHVETAAKTIGREEIIDGEPVTAIGAALEGAAATLPATAGTAARLPAFLSRAAPQEGAARILRPFDAAGLEEPALMSPAGDSGKRFKRGLLVHALLARLPDIAPETRESVAFAYLARQDVPAEDAHGLVQETLAVLNDGAFAGLFAQGSRAEVAVAAQLTELGNVRISGQIDRLAVSDDAVLIADFKTNRPPPASAEQTPRLYLAQMALYRAALAKIYPGKRIDCALIWTDGARLMHLPSALLDAEITNIVKAQTRADSALMVP